MLGAACAVELTGCRQNATLREPADGVAARLAAGDPEIQTGVGIVDGKAGRAERRQQHIAAPSVALALREHGVGVWLSDTDPEAARLAANLGAGELLPDGAPQADVAVIAVPPSAVAATLAAVPSVPIESLALLIGIDRFMSECRAITNLIGNGVATVAISRWEGEVNRETLREQLRDTR